MLYIIFKFDMIYSAILVPDVQQSEPVIHIYIFFLLWFIIRY